MDLYRNRDFIPDFDEILAETVARSQEIAGRCKLRQDITYGRNLRERMDILLPTVTPRNAPLHIFVHGGYWRSGSKADHHLVAAPVLAVGGVAAIIGYDLMPGTRLGTIVAQVRRATRYIQEIAPSLGADPNRLTVSGHSAGAHLASYVAAQGASESGPTDLPMVRGILMVSGIYNLCDIPISFLKDETGMTLLEAQSWSPITSEQMPLPRRIITRGALETAPFHEQAQAFADLLVATGQTVEIREEPALNHLTIVLSLGDPLSSLGSRLSELVTM